MHAWIIEGFVSGQQEGKGDTYDVAQSYLKFLIERCVIEVSQVIGDGHVMYCKMNDLLHGLDHQESKPLNAFLRLPKNWKCF